MESRPVFMRKITINREGENYPTTVTQHLNEADVLLLILDLPYFDSTECAKELAFFMARFESVEEAEKRIFLVCMLPPDKIKARIKTLEYQEEYLRRATLVSNSPEFAPVQTKGVAGYSTKADVISDYARHFAKIIHDSVKNNFSSPQSCNTVWEKVKPAWSERIPTSARSRPLRSAEENKETTKQIVIVVAGTSSAFRGASPRDAYDAVFDGFRPYKNYDVELGQLLDKALASPPKPYWTSKVDGFQEIDVILSVLKQTKSTVPIFVIIDPWSLRLSRLKDLVSKLDETNLPGVVFFALVEPKEASASDVISEMREIAPTRSRFGMPGAIQVIASEDDFVKAMKLSVNSIREANRKNLISNPKSIQLPGVTNVHIG
jgi:hypothetical protein